MRDGYNLMPALSGKAEEWTRDRFFAWVDDGTLEAVRFDRFKAHYSTQDKAGVQAWFLGQNPRKGPLLIDLRADPFEMVPEDSSYYEDWIVRRMFALAPTVAVVADHMKTYEEFPPRQEPGGFTPRQ